MLCNLLNMPSAYFKLVETSYFIEISILIIIFIRDESFQFSINILQDNIAI